MTAADTCRDSRVHRRGRRGIALVGLACVLLAGVSSAEMPYTEDFSSDTSRIEAQTSASWCTADGQAYLGLRRPAFGTCVELSHAYVAGTLATGVTVYFDTISELPMVLGSLRVEAAGYQFADNGQGVLVGPSGTTGTIDYASGFWMVDFGSLFLPTGAPIVVTYRFTIGVTESSDIGSDGDGADTTCVAVGDLNGDGAQDVVVGFRFIPIKLYLNNGTESPFSGVVGTNISDDVLGTWDLALGDVDGDGDLDVVAGNRADSDGARNRLYLNNGTAEPFEGVNGSDISTDSHNTYDVELGDMDGDGDLDVVVANNSTSAGNRLYLNNGTANPFDDKSTGMDISADRNGTCGIALGDVDDNGTLDVVAGNYHSGSKNRLYLNTGAMPFFPSGSDISSDEHGTYDVQLYDVNGDGYLDLLVGNDGTANRLYTNNATVSPYLDVEGSDIGPDTDPTTSLAVGDMNGDGALDLVAGNIDDINKLYLNSGGVDPFPEIAGMRWSALQARTRAIAIADMDSDGYPDVVTADGGAANPKVYLFGSSPSPFVYSQPQTFGSPTLFSHDVAFGDMDGDGDLDLVEAIGGVNRLYLNPGNGDFSAVTGSEITGYGADTRSLAIGDLDRDGDLDLVTGNFGQNRLYLNNGTSDPFADVLGSDISPHNAQTW